MPGITQDQIASAARWVLTMLSGMLAGLLISKGWLTTASGAELTTFIIGLAPSIASFIWSMWAHSTTGTIAAASSLQEVHSVITTPLIAHSAQFADNTKVVTLVENAARNDKVIVS